MRAANVGTEFTVGEWTVIPEQNSIQRRAASVHLEPRVMDLLVYFAERPNEVLSVEQIIDDVWPHSFVTDGALLTAISGLRRALGDDPRQPSYIATIPKRGYRLVAASSARVAVLAVLPIRNDSGDVEQSFLADGLTAGVIDTLGTIPALRVISRSSAISASKTDGRIVDIAKKLGARLVLAGSMTIDRHRQLGISLRLTDVTEGTTLLHDKYVRSQNEPLELEQDIVDAVATAIHDRLRSRPTAKPRHAHPDAVIEYLRGRYHFYRQSPDHFNSALEHFERAVDIDPNYALAHVGMADVWGAYGYWGARPAREVHGPILIHMRRAIEIDRECPDALVIRAAHHAFFDHDWRAAQRDTRLAIALNPNLCHTRLINSLILGTLRRPQALDEMDRALRIDPLNPAVLLVRGLIHSSLGDDQAALADTAELLDIDPTHPPGLQLRADLHWQTGNPDAMKGERELWPGDNAMLAALTDNTEASETLASAADTLSERSRHAYVSPYEIARLLCLGGRVEAALDCIERALDGGNFLRIDFLQLSPAFRAVRAHPRYGDIAGRVGVPV